ncbi:hypothetical protein F4818DRAFT_435635 [Hypoxylon cercidicola]|nr:hypothetical protein F4818DRAFT_435635 [Hypoxylon cercidicola]
MRPLGAGVKESSIINRIKMENWTSPSKTELEADQYTTPEEFLEDAKLLAHGMRSDNKSLKSIIFSQFTTMFRLEGQAVNLLDEN